MKKRCEAALTIMRHYKVRTVLMAFLLAVGLGSPAWAARLTGPGVATVLLLTFALFCMIVAFAFLCRHTRQLRAKLVKLSALTGEGKDNVRSSCPIIGWYAWNDEGTQEISPPLAAFFGLPEKAPFAQVMECFAEEERLKLEELRHTLEYADEQQYTYLSVKEKEDIASKPVILTLADDKGTKERFLEVNLIRVNPERPFTTGGTTLLWFRDVTDSMLQSDRQYFESEKLKHELKKFANILNFLPFPVWVRNSDLTITYCNFTYTKMVEQGGEHLVESEMLELDKQAQKLAKEVHKTGKAKEENRHIIIEGQRRFYTMAEMPMQEDKAQLGYGWDITAQKDVERELARHISAQSDLLESSASAMAIYGPDTKLKFFNQAFVKLWEIDERWLASQPTYGQVLEKLRDLRLLPEQANFVAFKNSHLRLFTDLIEPYNEFFYLPDGTALRVIVIPHALGGLLFAYEDMTDRLALERSYNTLIAVQKATLDNLNEGVAVFGENGRLKLSNPTYAKIWKLDPHVLTSEPHITEILARIKHLYNYGKDWEAFRQVILSMISKRVPTYQRLERTDGSVIDRMCVPLPDGATLMTYVDVTDSTLVERSLRERNKALQDADRIKTEFLANVSYELRSPLTSIMGLSEALEKQYFGGLNERQKEYVEGIYSSSHYLMSLINDILDLASIEAGYMKLHVERFDIHAALTSVLPLIKERLKESSLEFTFACPETIGDMVGDEKRIKQVVFKLLSNAIEFTDKDGKVTLGAEDLANGEVMIWIEDTGIGIPPEEQRVVFEKFYRTESSKLAGKSGTGLGLSVVKNFLELHGGRVELESEVGVGTTVRCYLKRENPELLLMSNRKLSVKLASI